MASQTDICNIGLQLLGAARIASINDQTKNARACLTCYDLCRQDELRAHPWNFAIQRFQLAASATPPAFGRTNAFPFPAGALRPLPPDPNFDNPWRDWIVESNAILSDDAAPLQTRFVMDITQTGQMDANFVMALGARMAMQMCEELTQSNTKKAAAETAYKNALATARKTNGIEKVAQVPTEDTWLTARVTGSGRIGGGGWCGGTQ